MCPRIRQELQMAFTYEMIYDVQRMLRNAVH